MAKRSILITGCSSGIGYCCAHGLRARGWRVLVTARKKADVAMLKAEGFEALELDYTDKLSIATVADDVLERTGGRLDAVFHNGAYGQPGAVEDLPVDVLRLQFEANVFGWHDLSCRLIPAMRRAGTGRIVHCSSVLGLVALKWRGAYNASKFAIEALSDTMRLELHGSGIYVCSIEPGPIRSRFRMNAIARMREHIDIDGSVHAGAYRQQLADEDRKLEQGIPPLEKPVARPFLAMPRYKLGPGAVLEKLVHAVESPRPRPHYHVTLATWTMAIARRVLPVRWLDRLAMRVS